ncbi:hypothetical protein OIK40_01870 [Erythrobacter sp. sf7]|uniref:Uncharacterized protein n=2 Tax=Erythrobacter fulvus TaxID=2987523 RepID=A0ABT5JMG8_9SPHN|nr:hypothetical protein [Erythrobacter fulvus]
MFRKVLKAVGGMLIAFGAIWGLQGLGLLDWPADSFMLGQRAWALYGAIAAFTGIILWRCADRG